HGGAARGVVPRRGETLEPRGGAFVYLRCDAPEKAMVAFWARVKATPADGSAGSPAQTSSGASAWSSGRKCPSLGPRRGVPARCRARPAPRASRRGRAGPAPAGSPPAPPAGGRAGASSGRPAARLVTVPRPPGGAAAGGPAAGGGRLYT